MPQREPQVRALPVSTTSCVCALALAPPCAHLSRPRRGRCAGPVAASLPEDDHGSTPTARERPTPKRSSRRYRDCGSNTRCAPARLLAHVWLHPSSLQAFALLSARRAARCAARRAARRARIAVPTSRRSMPVAPRRTRHPRRSSLRFALCTATRAPPFRSARFAGPRMAVLFRSSPLPRVFVCAPWQAHARAARALCGCALCRAATAQLRNR